MGEVRYIDDQYDVTFVVKKASVLDGLQRAVAIRQAEEAYDAAHPDKSNRTLLEIYSRIVCTWYVPDALTATVEVRNNNPEEKPETLDLSTLDGPTFLSLPEAMTEIWLGEVWRCNPHWVPGTGETRGNVNAPVAETGSTSDSPTGSKRREKAK